MTDLAIEKRNYQISPAGPIMNAMSTTPEDIEVLSDSSIQTTD